MAESASTSHLWDPDYSEEGKDFVFNNEGLYDVLSDNMSSLSKDLELSDSFWNLLLQRGVLDKVVQHKMKAKRTKRLQATSLVNHIIEGEVYKFHGFIWALVNSHQSHLAEQLGFKPCSYVDTEVFMMSSSFRCPACQEFYTKAYILTGCGHYVCAPCVKGSQFVCKENKKEDITCPVPECGKITEASPSEGNIGLEKDDDFSDLCQAVQQGTTEGKPVTGSEEEGRMSTTVGMEDIFSWSSDIISKHLQEDIRDLEMMISCLHKYRDVLGKNELGVKEYIKGAVEKVKENVDAWAKDTQGGYSRLSLQVETNLQKSVKWHKAASELSVLMRARPELLEGCLKGKVNLPKETVTDAAEKFITQLEAGCRIPPLLTRFPYLTIPPVKAKFLVDTALHHGSKCVNLAWTPGRSLMLVTSIAVWRLDFNTGMTKCMPTLIEKTSKASGMSVAGDGTGVLSLMMDGIIEIHYPGLEEVNQWRPEGVYRPWHVFINNKNIFVGEYNSQIIRSYSRELEYVDQYDIGTEENDGYIHVTERGRILKSSYYENRIYTMDLETKIASSFGSKGRWDEWKNFHPQGICTVNDDDYILACDYCNNRVSVFTHDGQFMHHLDVEGGIGSPHAISVLAQKGKPSLMALYGNNNNGCTVNVYSLE